MTTTRIPNADLVALWREHGVALCAEAQSDGVPCVTIGRDCATCEHALAAWRAAHPEHRLTEFLVDPYDAFPECGP